MIALLALAAAAAEPEVVDIRWSYVNVYALVGEKTVLVDTHWPNSQKKVLRKLRKAGVDQDSISLIVVTHAHADHAGSAAALGELLDVPVALGWLDAEAAEAGHNEHMEATGGPGRRVKPFLKKRFDPFTPDLLVDEPLALNAYGVDAVLIPVGGHTPGSLLVRFGDTAIVGDLVRSRMTKRHKPVEHYFMQDVALAHEALGELLEDGVNTVYVGHGGPFDADVLREWLPAE